jgi:hypothetical protein
VKKKRALDNVTLVSVSSIHIADTIAALKYSMRGIAFASVKLISHERPARLPAGITFCECPQIKSLDEYSHFMLYSLADHIDTAFCLTVQQDGFVVHPEQWRDEFLEYDYIGAPFPVDPAFCAPDGKQVRVGNGGFSLRSKKLLMLGRHAKIPFSSRSGHVHEDVLICVEYRCLYESHGCSFAPISVAANFSHEFFIPELHGIKPFGFHKHRKQNRFYPRFPKLSQRLIRQLFKGKQ